MGLLDKHYIKGASLLSEEEYVKFLKIIPSLGDFWWLETPSIKDDEAMLVTDLDDLSYDVVTSQYSVRPSLRLVDISKTGLMVGQNFMWGGVYWTILSNTLALADEPIGTSEFNDDLESVFLLKNRYSTSTIKKLVDEWYLNASKAES